MGSLENCKQYLDICYPSGKSLSEQHQMDRLHNEDIGIIWARHYPKRAESIVYVALLDARDDHSASRQIHDSVQRLAK